MPNQQRSLDALANNVHAAAATIVVSEGIAEVPDDVRSRLVELADEIVDRNREYLSLEGVHSTLLRLAVKVRQDGDLAALRNETKALIDLRPEARLQTPITHFKVTEPITILGVDFIPLTEIESPNGLEQRMLADGDVLQAVAEATCRGDVASARVDLVRQVTRALHVLVGAAWDLYAPRGIAIPGIYGSPDGGRGLHYKQADAPHFDAWHAGDGFVERPYIWPDTLVFFGEGRPQLEAALQSGQPSAIETSMLRSLEWLGEAATLGSSRSRYLRIGAAIEALLGSKDLRRDGIAAGLAERAAFLIGKTTEERLEVERAVNQFYDLRSLIVHGEADDVAEEKVIAFGSVCHRAAIGFARESAAIAGDLAGWTKRRRYESGPD